ncbi:MAG: protein kinase domain-containing protein [Planctomycetota bacterium]|jgi:serine/threonine-protein kinase
MSEAKGQNDKRPKGKDADPTRSFDSSVTGPGSQIGSFRIEQELGRGGAGVVYLAHDTKLDRSVAIKSLPPEVKDNPKALSRFTREARVLASLNHPNIAAIHDSLEEAEGVVFLVLEYVPGQTLAERIAKGLLKLEEALTIALQIAEAVAAAHEHDVIHRDLKPGNIKITPEGKVKVLDFGLAKAVGGEEVDQQSTITEPGRVIGTPAYMSPEQARGKPADKRSDIWSFGCVLYEMLTGRIPFRGETVSDTLANILQTDPEWHALPATTPANIRSLLRHCLKKDPRRRLQHMGDAAIEISEVLTQPSIASVENRPSRPVSWKVAGLYMFVGLVIGAVAILLLMRRPIPPSEPKPVTRFSIRPETNIAQEALWHHALALSPDGRRLAYVEAGGDGRRKIYLKEWDEFEAKLVPGTEGAISPFFSPDGEWIGYADHHQRKLKKVSVQGGQPIVLCESVQFRGGSWGTDDTIIFTPAGTGCGLWRISASGEGLEELTTPDPNQGEVAHWWPQILPGGEAVLFTNGREGGLTHFEVYLLETGKRHILSKGGTYARYVPTGHIVYGQKNTLYAIRFDLAQLKVVGSAFPVVPDVLTSEGWSWSAHFAISQGGSLAYIPVVTRSTELRPIWVDRQGQVEPLPAATPRNYGTVAVSPEGTQLAFDIQDGDNWDIWIYDLTRDTLNPLTSDGISDNPMWTSDGEWVVFRSNQAGKLQLFKQSVTGSAKPELIATFEEIWMMLDSCSPDGKELLLRTHDPKNRKLDIDISVIPFGKQNENPRLRPFIQRNNNQRLGCWSPDGRWVAYASDESGRWEVYVEPYPGLGPKVMISTEGGYEPAWSRDGKELFYRSGRGSPKMIGATIEIEPEFRAVEYKELFETINFRDYDVAPDGRFLMIQEPEEPTPFKIYIIRNWFEELKRLVPEEP